MCHTKLWTDLRDLKSVFKLEIAGHASEGYLPSMFRMGMYGLLTVSTAAKLAVYAEIITKVKHHQVPPNHRVDTARGPKSQPPLSIVERMYL